MDLTAEEMMLKFYSNFENCINESLKEGIITPQTTIKELSHIVKEKIELYKK